MVVVPFCFAVITPLVFIVATVVLDEDQTPKAVVVVKVTLSFTIALALPDIAATFGTAFTVIITVSEQEPSVYIKLNVWVDVFSIKLAMATPFEVLPKDTPVGLVLKAVQVPVVGLVPISVTLVPEHIV